MGTEQIIQQVKDSLEKNIGNLVSVGFCDNRQKMFCYQERLIIKINSQDSKNYIFIESVTEDTQGLKHASGQAFKIEDIGFCLEDPNVNYVVVGSPNNNKDYWFKGDIKKLWENRRI